MHEAEDTVAGSGRLVYFFGQNASEGDPGRKDILGGKGSSLAAMSRAGLPVPPGCTISIACCRHYHDTGGKWAEGLEEELRACMTRLEEATGKRFGEGENPLLVSVRSGALASMPGMMDTILNCGLHPGLESEVPDRARFWSVYAQFIQQFGDTVAGIPASAFEETARNICDAASPDRALTEAYMRLYERESGREFPLRPSEALRECINAVFESWNNERANTYRRAHGLENLGGTAVNIQAMFDSQVSGIAFTANPANPSAAEIIIESSYGLGQSTVSGDVTPDRFALDRESLQVNERTLGTKDRVMVALGQSGDAQSLDPSAASLTDEQITELARLALKVEGHFGFPVDIEWGLAHGSFSLLQSRAIRGLDVARDVETGRRQAINRLKQLAAGKRKVWVVHNLGETLEAPTPLTWDITRGFMSGNGGFGLMYKDFGYRPNRRVCEDGFLELICGRIYADPERAAGLFWEGMPLQYDPDEISADPRILEAAPTRLEPSQADARFLLRLPGTLYAMVRSARLMKKARRRAIESFEETVLPRFRSYVSEKRERNLSELSTPEVVEEIRRLADRVLSDFGKESLKPGFFGGCALAELEQRLVQLMGSVEGQRLCRLLTSGLDGDPMVEQNAMLFRVCQGKETMGAFLERYGHRAVGEMELANPRWREDAVYLEQIAERQKTTEDHSPEFLHRTNEGRRKQAMRELPETLAQWGGSFMLEKVEALAREAQALLPYREVGKHYLMMGYELIRMAILELGRRWKLGDDVFFLHLEELPRFEQDSEGLLEEIGKRKIRWQSAQRLHLTDVIDSEDLDQLGLPRPVEAARELRAVALSPGVVVGTARIIHRPSEAEDLGDDCILVCPSTDPGWTVLFTTIKGLIVERGGVLSHGAITARDFSIPAVACSDATLLIREAARLQVDGDRGHITIIED